MNMKIGLVGLAGALGLIIAGCGNAAPVVHNHKPAPNASATAKAPGSKPTPKPSAGSSVATAPINCKALPPSTVSIAKGASNGYTFNIPSTTTANGISSLYAGNTPLNNPKHLPPIYIVPNWETYIPHVPVVNDTHGAVSNCTAEEWGYGLLKMVALNDWGSTYDAPMLEQVTAAHTGSAPEFYGGSQTIDQLEAGDRQVATGGIWPTKLILVSLSASEQQDQQTNSKFAIIEVTPASQVQTVVTTSPNGQSSQSVSHYAGNGSGLLVAGNFETKYIGAGGVAWPFGPVFVPSSFQMCSADGVTSAVCGNAGVS